MSDDNKKGCGCLIFVAAIVVALLFAGGLGGRLLHELGLGRASVVYAPGEGP